MSCRTASTRYSFSEAYFRKLLKDGLVERIKIGYSTRMRKADLDTHFISKMKNSEKTA